MAPHDDEMNRRRQRREEMRQKQEAEQKRLKAGLIAAAVILVVCAVGLLAIIRDTGVELAPEEKPSQSASKATQPPETKPQTWAEQTATSTIHIRAAGDLNVTDSVVKSGLSASGYEYTRSFIDVAPLLSDADLTVMNLEGNIVGEPYGTARTSAPIDLLNALRSTGVDLIQMANSCTINNGLIGLNSTLQAIHNSGMEPLGAYATKEDYQRAKGYTICEAQGIKVAFVAFTKGLSGMGLPSGSEDCVNLLYKDYDSTYKEVDGDGIRKVLKNVAAEKPDITIALLHWGSEYQTGISRTQKTIANLLMDNGVDAILGTHPHILGPVDAETNPGKLTAYSLGDLLRTDDTAAAKQSMGLKLEFTKTLDGTLVSSWSYTPIYVATAKEAGSPQTLHVANAIGRYEAELLEKIPGELYDTLLTTEEKVADRVAMPEEDDEE